MSTHNQSVWFSISHFPAMEFRISIRGKVARKAERARGHEDEETKEKLLPGTIIDLQIIRSHNTK